MKHILAVLISMIVLLIACTPPETAPPLEQSVSIHFDNSLKPFYHGVASGDPLSDRVILWTRVTPETQIESIEVTWELSESENFLMVTHSNIVKTSAERDYTVKVDVDGLTPDRVYYYRFKALNGTSITGRTKTIPVNMKDSLKFAVVSCSNWEWGYFNPYDRIADRDLLDAVIHLGDYIYEHGTGRYGDTTIGRFNLPPYEIVSLQDYRTRYSLYRLDQGLRRVHQQHPFITVWDDHELANNNYVDGAQNHQPDKEGDFFIRKEAARKAYYEWLPIRESQKHYRSFSFGGLADLIMMDERMEGRTKPVDSITDPNYQNEERTMLGKEQLDWFSNQLTNSKATWKIIGNQVIFSDLELKAVYPKMPRNLDSWDGYPAEKKKIKDIIISNKLRDIIFLTGDTHASWAIEVVSENLTAYDPSTSRGAYAIEFGTTSVSSANDDEYRPSDTVKVMETRLISKNPHVKYLNDRDHGYMLITLTSDEVRSEWYYIETLREIDKREYLAKKLSAKSGSVQLK